VSESSWRKGRGHERWLGDAAAYALGALEEAEAARFKEHLARCPECQEELSALRSVVGTLASSAEPVAPPPEMRERVMAEVRADIGRRPSAAQAARRRWRGGGVGTPAIGIALAAAAAVVILVVSGGGGSSARTYAGTVYAPGGAASVRASGQGLRLTFSGLPLPPQGRIYEVWLRRQGQSLQPTTALFSARAGSIALPGSATGVRGVLVTAEPRPDGSRSPTRTPLIVVRLA